MSFEGFGEPAVPAHGDGTNEWERWSLPTDSPAKTSIAAPPPPPQQSKPKTAELLTGFTSGALLLAIALLHVGRFSECGSGRAAELASTGTAAALGSALEEWDWLCEKDAFAALAFLPLHALACCALVARCAFALRAGCGSAWRAVCCGRTARGQGDFTTLRLLEIFIGCYTLCWFAPLELESAAAATQLGPECVDKNEACAGWAASGECTKNEAFMRQTCFKACNLCKPLPSSGRSLAALLGKLLYYNGAALVGQAHRPRLLAVSTGGALLLVAAARLLMPGVLEQAPVVARCATRVLLRVLRVLAGACPLVTRSLLRAINCCRRQLIVALGGQGGASRGTARRRGGSRVAAARLRRQEQVRGATHPAGEARRGADQRL